MKVNELAQKQSLKGFFYIWVDNPAKAARLCSCSHRAEASRDGRRGNGGGGIQNSESKNK